MPFVLSHPHASALPPTRPYRHYSQLPAHDVSACTCFAPRSLLPLPFPDVNVCTCSRSVSLLAHPISASSHALRHPPRHWFCPGVIRSTLGIIVRPRWILWLPRLSDTLAWFCQSYDALYVLSDFSHCSPLSQDSLISDASQVRPLDSLSSHHAR